MYVNYHHSNVTVPEGVFGGSMCLCPKCCKDREDKQTKVEDKDIPYEVRPC